MKKVITAKKFIKKHLITIWLVIAAVAFSGILAYAKFSDGQNYTKRVVSTGTNDKVLFTSNLLNTSNTGHPKTVTKGYTSDSYYDINIYNYDKNKVSSYYPGTINYTLNAMLVKPDASSTVYDTTDSDDLNALKNVLVETQINDIDPDNPVITYTYHKIYIYRLIDGTPEDTPIVTLGAIDQDTMTASYNLTGEQLVPGKTGSAVESYRVVLPKEVIDSDVRVKITAEPNGHSDLPSSIGGVFYIQSQNIVITTGWNGEFVDSRTKAPSEYDAFNYRISGAGTANKVLKWNSTYLQPNKQEIADLFGDNSFSASTSQEALSLPLKPDVYTYDIQFYVKDAVAREYINGLTWDQLIAANLVSLEDP
ncbi:hypothetical protein SAMN02910447_03059 [Ruminococcus sp. YE71]|uniref:hypothetical protein n=1 Tax=unclassified Ruminococcus TaxID=2608920 RepID=UPI00088FD955|nr:MULTISPECIES: hypothetical protein [unclassified Ruminococcus]SDA29491.1 hypothetical protein SAMN02910446_03131 [Ruminococcus sp. YE78]SFW48369.1 hypothetical protein SAMN02910447_03059 [Ruminococcus sp. YE71]